MGFFMTIVPSPYYTRTYRQRIEKRNTYISRDKYLGGYVLYHDLDGEFVNGWKYKSGKVIAKIKKVPSETTRSNSDANRVRIREIPARYKVETSLYTPERTRGWEDDGTWWFDDVIITPDPDLDPEGDESWRDWGQIGFPDDYEEDPESGDGGYDRDGDDDGGYTPGVDQTEPMPSYSVVSSKFNIVAKMSSPDVYKLIGGMVYENYLRDPQAYSNACTLRLSYALNMSGNNIPYIKDVTGSGDVDKDGTKEWYFYRVTDMTNYLNNTYGEYDIVTINDIQGQEGIIGYTECGWGNATGHLDIWDGNDCLSQGYSNCDIIYFWKF